jgi:hypothetical protein
MRLSGRLVLAAALPAALMMSVPASAATLFSTTLTPLNGSGVNGTVSFSLSDDRSSLTVNLLATGLEPGQVHIGHIHGLFSNVTSGTPVNSSVPTLQQDTDRDGFIEIAEGTPTYGPVLVPFPGFAVDANGVANYSRVFNLLDPSTFMGSYTRSDLLGADLSSLDLREVVLHGMTVPAGPGAGTPGEVNGTNGYLLALPVAAGEITRVTAAVPEPSTWAMMLIGFGGIGYSMRIRRRQVAAAQPV